MIFVYFSAIFSDDDEQSDQNTKNKTEAGRSEVGNNKKSQAKRVYTKRSSFIDYSKSKEPKRKTKREREIEAWETLQTTHFDDVDDTNLSFL